MLTQAQMYYQAERNSAEANQVFLFLVETGMTREDLQKNIQRRPHTWGRFSNWLDKLPSEKE